MDACNFCFDFQLLEWRKDFFTQPNKNIENIT